ncbi:MAG: 3'-5' exonuclease [Desulfovibrionales bacterium]|nr:MAG: 3'-5' exonuclease [Desulfovibrionales bacterium]
MPWRDLYAKRLTQVRHPALRAFYQAGGIDVDTALEDLPMTAMDFETTGLDPAKDTIVSIGVIPFTLRRIFSSQGRYWVVNPGERLREDSVIYHRITHCDVKQCPSLGDVLPDVIKIISRTVVVVHYRRIERRFLDAAVRECWGEGIIFPVIDTMEIEARFHRQSIAARLSRLWANIRGRNERSLRLAASRSRYNLPVYAPHHALTDALATAELLQAQVAWRFSPETPVSDLWQ